MLSYIAGLILKLWGFQIKGEYPHHVPKKILVALPHTSNWDFPVGVLVRTKIKAKINFVGKSSLFKPPFGFIFKGLGGIPVDRSKSNNFVDATVKAYNEREKMPIVIAPEGTRKKVDKLKTGFYYIALHAKIPIYVVRFDWGAKVVEFEKELPITGDKEHDLKLIDEYFRTTKGKISENSYLDFEEV